MVNTALQPPADTTPVSVPPPTPGYRTSEAWLTFIIAIPALALNSGLVANAPLLAKLVSLAIAGLTVLGYSSNRTSLKRAHLAASSLSYHESAASSPRSPQASLIATAMLVAGLVGYSGVHGCATTKADLKQGGDVFLACGKQDLTQLVKDPDGKTQTLLKTVANDLAAGDYLSAIESLIAKVGGDAVGCAVLAVDTVVEAGKTSDTAVGAAALSSIELRAHELIEKYGWKTAPVPEASTMPLRTAPSHAQHAQIIKLSPGILVKLSLRDPAAESRAVGDRDLIVMEPGL